MTEPIKPTRNDPTPEGRVGDSRFLPVVIAAGVALIVILLAAVLLIGRKGKNVTPAPETSHPISQAACRQPFLAA